MEERDLPNGPLPLGKLPPALLASLLERAPVTDPDVVIGPAVGVDCAVVRLGERWLVFKSDPITFATGEMGRYLVHVNANDIATTGAKPRWLLVTLLLPEGMSTGALVEELFEQVYRAARELDIAVVGGHTEVTHGLSRPLAAGTLIGEVSADCLVTPKGASPGDILLLTKGVPIEGTAILAREFPGRLEADLSAEELATAANFLYEPGISVLPDAQIAMATGKVTAMHDPTEGGLAAALWELALASDKALQVHVEKVPVPTLSRRICEALGLNPLATIASGALLLAVAPEDAPSISAALKESGIDCAEIGTVRAEAAAVWQAANGERQPLAYPERDEITRAFEM